jgi:hypothetical protein
MRSSFHFRRLLLLATVALAGAFVGPPARAVPSYARQTGWSCAVCHTIYPQLTPIGRLFKLEGYTTANYGTLQQLKQHIRRVAPLAISRVTPLSVFIQASDTYINSGNLSEFGSGGPTQQAAVEFPEQVSLFYAGRITSHIGTFYHLTYTHSGAFGQDDSDIRWADHIHIVNAEGNSTLIYGAEINNTPTEPDVWNSVSDWNWPYYSSNYTPLRDIPLTFIQQSAGASEPLGGIGGYVAYLFGQEEDHWLYAELDLYRSGVGIGAGTNTTFGAFGLGPTHNVAPYLRLAYEENGAHWNWELGTLAMDTHVYTTGAATGPVDRFLDYGLDTQVQYLTFDNSLSFTAHASWIREIEDWYPVPSLSFRPNPVDSLNYADVNGQVLWHHRYGGGLGFFDVWGTADPSLYGADTGNNAALISASGSPDTDGITLEADYLAAQNAEFSLQYSRFFRYLGASTNYNGQGRNASQNNVVSLLMWLAF